jgi:hypothetical protein
MPRSRRGCSPMPARSRATGVRSSPTAFALLRPHRNRPSDRRAAEKADELAPSHVQHCSSVPAGMSSSRPDQNSVAAAPVPEMQV